MKRLFMFAVICLITTACFAQTFTVLKETNGRIGIGLGAADVPSQMLEVKGNIMAQGALIASQNNPNIGGALFIENPAKTAAGIAKRWAIFNMGGGYSNSLQFWAYDSTGCAGGLCAQRFVILDNGNVGIGVSNPLAKLTVAGGIASRKVKVSQNLDWPDYVFGPAYKLPSLQELDRYIKVHQHLPDMPSAEDVAQNGLDLGENQALLLKKIEELTLYVIELEKKIGQIQQKM